MQIKKNHLESFLKHQTAWSRALVIGWFAINIVVLSTTQLMEFNRSGQPIETWQPFCWEASSALMILLLIPVGTWINDHWVNRFSFKQKLIAHLLLTLPFSLVHIVGMVMLRKFCYWLIHSSYHFGDLWVEFIYEYRKDAQSYLTIFLVILGYRLIVRRLQGEASYIAEGETESELPIVNKPERLLIKKLGREFLIQVKEIEWVEASGNYANLHIQNSVYPMRITMDKLEKLLPDNFIRIHRSTIVDLAQVKEIQPLDSGDYLVKLHNGQELNLSRRYRENFKSFVTG